MPARVIMGEPFKNLIHEGLVRTAGQHLQRVWQDFDRRRFERLATNGLDALELKARVLHVSVALEATLPPVFADAASVLERSLAPARVDVDLSALQPGPDGLAGWIVWPMTEFVARRGLADPRRALLALHAMTQRNTAEYAIRPFVQDHAKLTFVTLHRWLDDPSPHVRRLVSEGSRPRLPWGMQLKALVADPSPTLPLLEALQHDVSDYVRRSVANHLNDIAKDHPAIVAEWLEQHLPAAGAELRALLKHASRTLVKRGDARVLDAWGIGKKLQGTAMLRVRPERVAVGGEIELAVELHSTSKRAQKLVVDYAIHHRKANGSTSPKVWKGWAIDLAALGERSLGKRHSLRPVTTRRDYPGKHRIDLRINGQVVASDAFELLA
ncbi:MAG: DNA alkylation repair protein [Planctomycetota bacterium]